MAECQPRLWRLLERGLPRVVESRCIEYTLYDGLVVESGDPLSCSRGRAGSILLGTKGRIGKPSTVRSRPSVVQRASRG